MSNKQVPEWVKIVYRGIRAAIASGIAQIILIPDWQSQPERTLLIAFLTGFIPAFGMWTRDQLDKYFGFKPDGLVQKIMPF
jgi:hypothetical protein